MEIKIKIPEWGNKIAIVGIEEKEGEFNGRPYKNTVIHGLSAKELKNGNIIAVAEQIKTKQTMGSLCVGDWIEFYYNRYGQVDQIHKIERKE